MPNPISWETDPAPASPAEDTAAPLAPLKPFDQERYNFGMTQPLQWDGNDFASGSGVEMHKNELEQLLCTECQGMGEAGELAWNTEFGSLMDLLRQRKPGPAMASLAQKYIIYAIQRWMPQIVLKQTQITQYVPGRYLVVRVVFDVKALTSGTTLYPNVLQEIAVSA